MKTLDTINRNAEEMQRNGTADPLATQELLFRYLHETDGEVTELSTAILTRHIVSYARVTSPMYGALPVPPLDDVMEDIKKLPIFSKDIFYNKSLWYVEGPAYMETQTSGSTGPSFKYRLPSKLYGVLEGKWHYSRVLKEYGLSGHIKIVHVANPTSVHYKPEKVGNETLSVCRYGEGPLWNYGSPSAEVVAVAYPGDCYKDKDRYCQAVLELIRAEGCDLLATTGGFIATLADYVARNGIGGISIKLMSSTAQPVLTRDVDTLRRSGLVYQFCDHMRCWDGGASFMTCKHGTNHLLDDLAYVHATDGRMVSVDYFNIVAPFVNYWNGDYCTIGAPVQCACGRTTRAFKIDKVRDFVLIGHSGTRLSSQELEQLVWTLPEGSSAIQLGHSQIGIKSPLDTSQADLDRVKDLLYDFTVRFMVAEPTYRVNLMAATTKYIYVSDPTDDGTPINPDSPTPSATPSGTPSATPTVTMSATPP